MTSLGLDGSFARFLVVGCLNFAVSSAAFYASYRLLPDSPVLGRAAVSNVVAYAAGALSSFVLNRTWTFRAEGHFVGHASRFLALNAITLAASTLIMLVLVDWIGWQAIAVWLPLTLVILLAHYLGMKHWAFVGRGT